VSSAAGRRRGLLALVGPGVLVAATGVGAGDLATAGFAGAKLGVAVAWAVLLGAAVKYVLSENLARWQLGTGETVLEGAITRLGWIAFAGFGIYLLPWSVFVGTALARACGVTVAALVPATSPIPVVPMPAIWGGACSLLGLGLVWLGGFRLFERVMAVCVGVMVATTLLAAGLAGPEPGPLIRGLLVPTIPDAATLGEAVSPGEPLRWTIALLGGVGGTLTIIAYSYWMRETGREDPEDLRTCRLDLAAGYGMTALFGVAMLVVASGVGAGASGRGVGLVVGLADAVGGSVGGAFGEAAGRVGRTTFLLGTFAAVFSSLLGVWQVVPLIFADWWGQRHRVGIGGSARPRAVDPRSAPARGFLVWIALASLPGLLPFVSFAAVQQWYGYVGALFIPGLALTLLRLNGRGGGLPDALRNRWSQSLLLGAASLAVIGLAAWDILGLIG
jgi:Mn2+/Fe2+ NRAMP family transporter